MPFATSRVWSRNILKYLKLTSIIYFPRTTRNYTKKLPFLRYVGRSPTNDLQFAAKSIKSNSRNSLILDSYVVPFRVATWRNDPPRSALGLVQSKKSADLLSGISRRMLAKRGGGRQIWKRPGLDMQRCG